MSQECWGAKCLQLHPVIAFREWANDCGRAEYALIALLSSPSQRSQLRRLTSHYSKMPAISRWSGRGDSVPAGDRSNPGAPSTFYSLSVHKPLWNDRYKVTWWCLKHCRKLDRIFLPFVVIRVWPRMNFWLHHVILCGCNYLVCVGTWKTLWFWCIGLIRNASDANLQALSWSLFWV